MCEQAGERLKNVAAGTGVAQNGLYVLRLFRTVYVICICIKLHCIVSSTNLFGLRSCCICTLWQRMFKLLRDA